VPDPIAAGPPLPPVTALTRQTSVSQAGTNLVGAAAWPRSRMHGARPVAAGPPLPPDRCSHQTNFSLANRHRSGRSGRLAAKQNARCQTPSRRGRRSHRIAALTRQTSVSQACTNLVGAAAWPRSRMHGARPVAAGPPLPPDRCSHQAAASNALTSAQPLQPNRIPMRVISDTLSQPGPQRIADDVPRHASQIVLLAQCMVMVTGLPAQLGYLP